MVKHSIADCRLYGFIDTAFLAGRDPGVVTRQLIAGGVDIIQVRAKNIKSARRLALALAVTRAAADTPVPVIVNDGAARLASNGALAGSTLLFYKGLKNIYEITGMPLKELIKTTSWNQARSLGLDKLGKIEPGFYADILILQDDFSPEKVFVDGEIRA